MNSEASERDSRKTDNRVFVVTGASAGVGRAIVRELARPGIRIGLLARGRDGLEGAKRDVEAKGAQALTVITDVSDFTQVQRAADEIEQQFGPIDVWVNNAMLSVFSPVHLMEPSEYKRVTEVTYLGYVYGTLAALKSMRRRDKGVIIQVGSALAYRSIPLQSAYCAAKHAIVGFTESLRTELLHERSGIQVVNVHLPAVNTPQFEWVKSRLPLRPQPVPPIYQPEVVARAIVWAIDHPRRELWLGYPTIKAIVGDKLVPDYADRYLACHGYDSQQTDEPVPAGRQDNLWHPVAGDHGAHGRFDRRSHSFSLQIWLSMHRNQVAMAGLALAGLSLRRLAKTSKPLTDPFE